MPTDPFAGYFAACPNPDSNDLGVYADWLQEHGDPHAPAVRAEAAAKVLLPPSDVHGVLAAARHLRARFTRDQLAALSTIPWPADLLAACAGTHLLVAGCPLSILGLQTRRPGALWQGSENPWYAAEAFAGKRRVGARWHLVRKGAPPDSTYKPFLRQKHVLSRGERVARACEVTYAVTLHHLVTGQRLLEDASVRCADTSSLGARVIVGPFLLNGLYIGPDWWDSANRPLGVACGRTP